MQGIGQKCGQFIDKYIAEACSIAGVAGISYMGIFSVKNFYLFFLFIFLSIGSIFLTIRRNKKNDNYAEQVREKNEKIERLENAIKNGNNNFFDLWDNHARSLFKECSLNNDSRLSIYKYDEIQRSFWIIGRHAEQVPFKARNRKLYPTDQGVIGKAWLDGEYYEKSLPNPYTNPDKYTETNLQKYGIPREISAKINMKSTCLWAKSLKNKKGDRFAIVVIESTKRDSLARNTLSEFFENGKGYEIQETLDALGFMEPNLRIAGELGI